MHCGIIIYRSAGDDSSDDSSRDSSGDIAVEQARVADGDRPELGFVLYSRRRHVVCFASHTHTHTHSISIRRRTTTWITWNSGELWQLDTWT